jgi:hypothetical protein
MIYFITVKDKSIVKIGYSDNVPKRLKALQIGSPELLYVYAQIHETRNFEKILHDRFQHLRSNGEWFHFTDEIRNEIHKLVIKPVLPEIIEKNEVNHLFKNHTLYKR